MLFVAVQDSTQFTHDSRAQLQSTLPQNPYEWGPIAPPGKILNTQLALSTKHNPCSDIVAVCFRNNIFA